MSACATVFPINEYCLWDRFPREPDLFDKDGLTLLDEKVWRILNHAIQRRGGRIPVADVAKIARRTERAIYNSRVRLRAAGLIDWEMVKGRCVYRLPWRYPAARPPDEGVGKPTPASNEGTTSPVPE